MFDRLSELIRSFQTTGPGRFVVAIVVALLVVCCHATASIADDMADVHKAMNEDRLFDAFQELVDLAKQGNAEAQYELAGFYHWGRVGAANFTKARTWYQRSANQGNTDAMIGLAILSAAGQGGPVDKPTAAKWLIIADNIRKLPPSVAEWRDQLTDALTPAEISTITAEAKAFKTKPEN